MVSKDQCAPVHIHVDNPCAWNPALRESAPGPGACDWPRLAMVAGAASTKFLWGRWSKGGGVGLGLGGLGGGNGGGNRGGGGGGGGQGGGLWAQWGQWGGRVEKVPRG